MKLRRPWMIQLAAWLGVGALRCWMRTIRCHTDSQGQGTEPWDRAVREHFIYALWHDSLLSVPRMRSCLPVTALISQSRDGELLAAVCRSYRVRTVRGSSTRGGIEAVGEAVEAAKCSHLLVAPDGPRGPRREVKRGLVYLASWSGLRIVPLGIGFERAWHVGSWDRTSVPKPFSTITCLAGPVIAVPGGIGKMEIERYRQNLQDTMLTASSAAQQWAERGKLPPIYWPQLYAAAA